MRMKLLSIPLLLLSVSAAATLSPYDQGRCEAFGYRAEEICVGLVCGDTDRDSIRECKDTEEFSQVMTSCWPRVMTGVVSEYNQRASGSRVSCGSYQYRSKF